MKKIIIAVFFLLLIPKLYCSDAKFSSINEIFGLTIRETGSICQDENGFVWTASKTGILRVSESSNKIYQLPYKTADVVYIILVYRNLKLYACTNNGQLFLYDNVFDKFNLIADIRTIGRNSHIVVNSVQMQDDGSLWISSNIGLYRFKDKLFSLIRFPDSPSTTISLYGNNKIFVATSHRIGILNTKTLKCAPLVKFAESTLVISKLFYDNTNRILWVGTSSDGLFCYHIKTKRFEKVLPGTIPAQPIRAIEKNGENSIFIGIDGQGIWELSKNGDAVLNIYKEDIDQQGTLPGDGVYDIFCEKNKRVWVSTYGGGLSFFDQQSPLITQLTHRQNSSNSLVNNCINKVIQDKRGNLWMATNNGVSRWNRTTNQWTSFYHNEKEQASVFLALAEDNDGNIWAGTYSSGVYVLDGKTGRELIHFSKEKKEQSFSGNYIFSLMKDSDGDMWMGGIQSNVICYRVAKKESHSYSSQPVKSMAQLMPGKILLGCSYGLLLLDKQKGIYRILLQGYIVHDIVVANSVIWVATSGDGLLKYEYTKGVLTKYNTNSGLPSNYVNSIIAAKGYYWLGTENGLCRFNPADGKVLTFSSVFSLSKLSFNTASKYELANGDLVFGSNNGAVIFNPEKMFDSNYKGKIYINDIKLSGRSIKDNPKLMKNVPLNQKKEITLNYDQNTLEFEMIPVGVTTSGFKYSWKMDGIDKEWNLPLKRRIIVYTNLPAGDFQLRVRMYDSSLSVLIDERIINIHIIPPFWERWWFRFIIVALCLAIIYFSLKTYIDRLKQQHDEEKLRFFTSMAHDIRTSLTLIKAPIEELNNERNLSNVGRYNLNLAIEQSGRLSSVATQLLDFEKVDVGKGQLFLVMVDVVQLIRQRKSMFEAMARKKNVEITFATDRKSFVTAIDELKIEKVVDNLISNAVKYSNENSCIDVKYITNTASWTLEVKDYGIGISKTDQKKLFREFYRGDNSINSKMVGSGIGLLLVKNYVTLHNGDVELISNENEGTTFRISIPFKRVSQMSKTKYDVKDSALPEMVDVEEQFLVEDNESLSEKRANLLIVEDNNDLQNFLKNSFEPGYKVSVAGDGKQAWDLIQKKLPDLVISDIMMPNMDGFELCRLIKSTFDTAHIPVVLLTALCEKSKQLEGLGLGADDYITKPFDMKLLSQRISSIIYNRRIVKDKSLKFIKQQDTTQPILVNELNDQFVKKALEVVRANIDNCDFGKDEFASAMNASPSLLYKKIKTLTGLSPVDFIKSIRLDYSLELLQSRKYSVTEVSELCGFSSVGYFSTVFKKYYGKSPTDVLD